MLLLGLPMAQIARVTLPVRNPPKINYTCCPYTYYRACQGMLQKYLCTLLIVSSCSIHLQASYQRMHKMSLCMWRHPYNRPLVSTISCIGAHLTNPWPIQAGPAVILQLQCQGETTLRCLSLLKGELQATQLSFTTSASCAN